MSEASKVEFPKNLVVPSKHSSWSRRLEDVLCLCLQKTSWRRICSPSLYVLKTLARHLQNVFKTYSTRSWDVLHRRLSTERFVYSLWSRYIFSKSKLFGYTETLSAVLLKQIMKWLLPRIKVLFLKSETEKMLLS